MDRTPTVNLGAAGLLLAARLYVGGEEVDGSGAVVNDRGAGDYNFDIPLQRPYAAIIWEQWVRNPDNSLSPGDPNLALWIFNLEAPAAFQPVPIPAAVLTASPGLTRVVEGSDTLLRLKVSGLPTDPTGATVELDLVYLGGAPAFSGLAASVTDVVGVSGRFACTLFAPIPWSAWPTTPPPRAGVYWARFALTYGGGLTVLPADTSLRLELMGVPS